MKASLVVLFAVSIALAGDVFFKKASGVPWLGFLLYAASGLPIWYSYRIASWMQIGVLWQALAIVMTIGVGVLVFGEVLSWRKIAAFGLALISAWLAMA